MLSSETMSQGFGPKLLEVHLLPDHDASVKKVSSPGSSDSRPAEPGNSENDVSFLRLPDVKRMTGLSKSTLYALIRSQTFPAPVQLGPRTVAWVRSEVMNWAVDRISASRAPLLEVKGRRAPQRALGQGWASTKKYA